MSRGWRTRPADTKIPGRDGLQARDWAAFSRTAILCVVKSISMVVIRVKDFFCITVQVRPAEGPGSLMGRVMRRQFSGSDGAGDVVQVGRSVWLWLMVLGKV